MKKALLVFGLSVPVLIAAQAQVTTSKKLTSVLKLADETVFVPAGNTGNAERASLWSSDFSDNTDWTLGSTLGSQGTWEIGTAPATFTPYIGTPTALTAPYAYFNCVQYMITTPPTLAAQNAWIQGTSSINVSGINFIRVSYNQLYRAFNVDQVFVEIANAATPGTWVTNEVNTEVPTNLSTTNMGMGAGFTHFNVSGMDSILVRFRWSTTADQGGGGYGWIIDDVDVSEAPTNDVKLASPFIGLYTKYPLGQEVRDVEMSVAVANDGSAAQSLSLSAVAGSPVGTVAAQSFAAFDRDTVPFTEVFNPAAGIGVKTVTFKGTYSPGPDTVRSVNKSIEVVQNTFSKDRNQYIQGFDFAGSTVNNLPILNVLSGFRVTAAANATSVSVMFGGNSTAGSSFQVTLYGVDQAGNLEQITQSDIISLTAAQINTTTNQTNPKVVRVDFFNQVIPLEPGEYWVSVENQGGTVGVAYDPFDVAREFPDAGGSSILFSTANGVDDLFRLIDGNTPSIRLNLNEAGVGFKEEQLSKVSVSVFPNPSSDVVNVTLKDFSGMTQVKMYNMNGQLVLNENVNVTSNTFVKSIDVSSFAAGVYTLTLSSEAGVSTQKVAVK